MDLYFIFSFIYSYVVLRMEPSASHMLGKRPATEPSPACYCYICIFLAVDGRSDFTLLIYLFTGAEDGAQGLTRTRQVLCH